jgi:hypothetical protein
VPRLGAGENDVYYETKPESDDLLDKQLAAFDGEIHAREAWEKKVVAISLPGDDAGVGRLLASPSFLDFLD